MSTLHSARNDGFLNQYRRPVEFDARTQLPLGNDRDALGSRFLESNDAAGNVPSGPIKRVASPREQRSAVVIADQQVDIDERCDSAHKKK